MSDGAPFWRHVVLRLPHAPPARTGWREDWERALTRESRMRVEGTGMPPCPLSSLFVGGGGGQHLGGELPRRVQGILGAQAFAPDTEWTVEITGWSRLNRSILRRWAQGGVGRVSLRGRGARPDRVNWIREAGIPVISVDLRLPSPPETVREWLGVGIDQVTLSEAESARGRAMGQALGRAPLERAIGALVGAGWMFTDWISASAPGITSGARGRAAPRVREAIRRREPVLGLGPGAVSTRGRSRWWNFDEWEPYLSHVSRGELPEAGSETLSTGEVRLERVWSALQGPRGIRIPGPRASGPARALVREWCARGWVLDHPTRLILTHDGSFHLDAITVAWVRALELAGGSTEPPKTPNFDG
jgi:hypothetical protein